MPSVHDNHLFAYAVDAKTRTVILHTEYAYGLPPYAQTDVVFTGVLDHYFRDAVLPSIVFGVDEIDTQEMIREHKEQIDEGHRIAGWPSFWRDTVEGMAMVISEGGYKTFEISSSYGFHGWVVAKACAIQPIVKQNG